MDRLRHFQLLLRKMGLGFPSPKSLKACPRCGSVNIKFSTKFDVWLTPKRYVCNDCGYIGPVVLEIEETEEQEPRKA